ncbi:MAG: HlyD family efflux transporter periplasmic adaptor subunit [Methylobacter sp.]
MNQDARDDDLAQADGASPWDAFINANTSNELCQAWLALICEQIPGASAAAVLVENQEMQIYVPMAVWPKASPSMGRLAKIVELCLRDRRGVVESAASPQQVEDAPDQLDLSHLTRIAYPILLEQRVSAVVAVEAECDEGDVNRIFRDIHWASAWLSSLLTGRELEEAITAKAHVGSVLEVIAVVLRHGKLQQVLFEMVNELRQRLGCARVAIGLANNDSVKLTALSEAATFEKNTSLAKAYMRAMEEAYDHGKVELLNVSSEMSHFPMHRELMHISGSRSVISCPLFEGGRIMGVLVLESSGKAFDDEKLAWLDAFTAMAAPIISQRKKAEQNGWLRLADEAQSVLAKLFGPRYLIWKAAAAFLVVVLASLLLVHIDYRVTAKTVIEGEIQRVISAPFDGFIGSSYVRAGDTVKQGQLLASLDDRELMIEKARWASERDQYDNRLREAMATHDLSEVQVLGAQLNQAEAELNLVTKKIEYAHLLAPFDGLVISGDLSQQVGAPVEVGKKLFEIAPLQSYRVILQIDERDIRHIKIGQSGMLVITGIAGDALPLTIQKVTPVATAEDGKNFFRVEASLSDASTRLRPGMEGIGKVVTDRHSLWWVLIHSFTDWLTLTLWTWMP